MKQRQKIGCYIIGFFALLLLIVGVKDYFEAVNFLMTILGWGVFSIFVLVTLVDLVNIVRPPKND